MARNVSMDELNEYAEASLTTILALAKAYDTGHTVVSFSLAAEMYKLLTENPAAVKYRKNRIFTSPNYGDETKMLNSMHKLTGVVIEPGHFVSHVPDFYFCADDLIELDFNDWWIGDIIYRASASPAGSSIGCLPVNDSPIVPWEKRDKFSRQRFLYMLRVKLGSHQDPKIPVILDQIDSSLDVSVVCVKEGSDLYCTDNGGLSVRVGPVAATVRQIAHETLIAYGRADPVPLNDLTSGFREAAAQTIANA